MRRALGLLDSARLAGDSDLARDRNLAGDSDIEWRRMRIRLLLSLALSVGETGSMADGMAGLNVARQEIQDLPDGLVRSELTGFLDHNHAVLVGRAGRHEESVALLDSAIEHEEQCLAGGTDDPAKLTEALIASLVCRGLMYSYLGRPGPARPDLNRATALAVQHKLPMSAAFASHILGNLEKRVGDVPEALRNYDEAERVYKDLAPGMVSRLRLDQAEALLMAGLADEAGRHLDEVLPEMYKQRIGQDLGEAELFRAAAALLDGEPGKARRMSASARRRLLRRGSESYAAIAALIGLRVDTTQALVTGKVPASLPAKALRIADQLATLRLPDEAALARLLAVRMELHRKRPDKADALLGGVPAPRRITPIDHRMLLRLCKAELAVAQGDQRAALRQARAGLTELDRVRDRMGGLELVSGTALHGRELGELAVQLVLDGGSSASDARRLFDWLERTRAQTYRYEPVSATEDPQLAERIAEIRHLSRALQQARLDGGPTAELNARYMVRQREARRMDWHINRWGRSRSVASIAEVSGRLAGHALVSFAASGDSMVAVVVVEGRVRMVRLGSATEAAEQARRLHADLDALAPDHLPEMLVQVVSASAQRQADLLDIQLLRPLAGLLGDRDVVIVPTGALYAVPWGVLPSLRSRPTVVAPSATAWLAATNAEHAAGPRNGAVVLVRGPGLDAAVGEIDKLAAHHRTAVQLPAESATVETVLAALDGAELAHIAAHGAHEPENALFSRLELVDGFLFAHETARLRRAPRQVVLAACELALNRIRPGDEALGFAGALLASGANTVVAATSRVGDEPAAAAMDDYHRALASGASPAVALAEAVAADPLRRPFVGLGCGGV
ncbi:CHAT domain-containing protein [Solihabitans fulvus]|uniref:CHAT domain-containing protein n=1 Tax=Solihabitans fulvus TaxID=1892852 RepID=A0A5B2XMY9_9PSEU|nr:CHAT domain-containing protein [Solihabitans fulvus]KAA2264289.1 CHAT domain-containing protein [Solihabitans fulvus]